MRRGERHEQDRNALLDALPAADYAAVRARLEDVDLEVRDVIYASNQPIQHVYFPHTGVISIIAPLPGEDAGIEVATMGNEGMAGVPLFLGVRSTPLMAFAQVRGKGWRMPADTFLEHAGARPALAAVLHRYTQALMVQIAQNTACNRAHTTLQRCARWLLMTHDRVDTDRFDLTQEFLGQMLGLRRAAVNAAAASLQRKHLIRYTRGTIEVLDRPNLEAQACECYKVIRTEFDRLHTDPRPTTRRP